MRISTSQLNLLSQFGQFSSNVDYVSHELVELRNELDQFEDRFTPTDTFNPAFRAPTRPGIAFAGIVLFSLCMLCFDARPARLLLCAVIVLAIYESVTVSLSFRTTAYASPLSGASIGIIGLMALASVVTIPARDLFLVYLLVTSADLLGKAIDRHYPHQPLPRPCPNLCLHRTSFGLLGTILLPALIVPGLIQLQFLDPRYYPLASVGLAVVVANLSVAIFKRGHGVRTSNEISTSRHHLSRLYSHATGGLLDHFAPLIFACALLLALGFVL